MRGEYIFWSLLLKLSCLPSVDKRCGDTRSRDRCDAKRIIIVVVQGPQDDAGDLKDVEWVDDLSSFSVLSSG